VIIGYNARSTFAGTVEIVIGMHVNLYSKQEEYAQVAHLP